MDVITATEQFPQFLREAKDIVWNEKPNFKNVLLWGVGDEAIVVHLAKRFLTHVPVFTITDGSFPEFIREDTLVILLSYSGNTDAVCRAYDRAKIKNCPLFVLTAGGKLREKCLKDNTPRVRIPSNLPTQAAFPYLFLPIINYFSRLGGQDIGPHVDKARESLNHYKLAEKAKELAKSMQGKTPLIYATPSMIAIANRWKSQINKHAKVHAYTASLPQFITADIESFNEKSDNYYVLLMQDEQDHIQTKQTITAIKTFIRERGVDSTEIAVSGKSLIVRVLTALYLGDLVSLELAKINQTDPITTPMRAKLHSEIKWMSNN